MELFGQQSWRMWFFLGLRAVNSIPLLSVYFMVDCFQRFGQQSKGFVFP